MNTVVPTHRVLQHSKPEEHLAPFKTHDAVAVFVDTGAAAGVAWNPPSPLTTTGSALSSTPPPVSAAAKIPTGKMPPPNVVCPVWLTVPEPSLDSLSSGGSVSSSAGMLPNPPYENPSLSEAALSDAALPTTVVEVPNDENPLKPPVVMLSTGGLVGCVVGGAVGVPLG